MLANSRTRRKDKERKGKNQKMKTIKPSFSFCLAGILLMTKLPFFWCFLFPPHPPPPLLTPFLIPPIPHPYPLSLSLSFILFRIFPFIYLFIFLLSGGLSPVRSVLSPLSPIFPPFLLSPRSSFSSSSCSKRQLYKFSIFISTSSSSSSFLRPEFFP